MTVTIEISVILYFPGLPIISFSKNKIFLPEEHKRFLNLPLDPLLPIKIKKLIGIAETVYRITKRNRFLEFHGRLADK